MSSNPANQPLDSFSGDGGDGGEKDHGSSWEEHGSDAEESVLLRLVQSYDWAGTLQRIASHPHEAASLGMQGRTPLHVACDHDAPAVIVERLLKAYPEASVMVGTSNMNPLHITCSSQHASVYVVQVLLEGGMGIELRMQDVDGDTPLHTACRCGAPIEVLDMLLRGDPSVVVERDYEGLTPLLRLWVRYFVTLGEEAIDAVREPADMTVELGEAWNKTELLLRFAHGQLRAAGISTSSGERIEAIADRDRSDAVNDLNFRAVHTVSAVDCPRAVVRIATMIHPEQLTEKNEEGLVPLMIAASAPIYKVHDLSDAGYSLEDVIHGDEPRHTPGHLVEEEDSVANSLEPSVIDLLLEASPRAASFASPEGRFPLHLAISSGKKWSQGVSAVMDAYPDAIMLQDGVTGLHPYSLAAVGDKADLNTIYELLRANPALLQECVGSTDNDSATEDMVIEATDITR